MNKTPQEQAEEIDVKIDLLNSKSTDIPNAIPKGQVGERRKITAYLRKRASDEECMKNVKFTPNPNAS